MVATDTERRDMQSPTATATRQTAVFRIGATSLRIEGAVVARRRALCGKLALYVTLDVKAGRCARDLTRKAAESAEKIKQAHAFISLYRRN